MRISLVQAIVETELRVGALDRERDARLEAKWQRALLLEGSVSSGRYLGVSRSTFNVWRGLHPADRIKRMAREYGRRA